MAGIRLEVDRTSMAVVDKNLFQATYNTTEHGNFIFLHPLPGPECLGVAIDVIAQKGQIILKRLFIFSYGTD